MDLLSKFERRFGSWAVPHLTLYLLLFQVVGFALLLGGQVTPDALTLRGGHMLYYGEWYRLVTFMMMPATTQPIWFVFAFYFLYLTGSALEGEWGAFRFNLFVLAGYLCAVGAAFVAPAAVIANQYLLGTIFLAFATLYPNFEILLFFILPVKVKWLGMLTAFGYAISLLFGGVAERLGAGSAFLVYVLFFGRSLLRGLRAFQRRKAFVAQQQSVTMEPRHVCAECGLTDEEDQTMDFRYCSVCGKCFCARHIKDHAHPARKDSDG